jgi:hypothetical protein
MRKHNSKVICQRIHAKSRFKERLGLDITTAQIDAMVKTIQMGYAKFVERQSARVSKWEMTFNDRPYYVIYDKRTKSIVTILFKENTSCPQQAV